jgi:Holliday junction resolvase
MENKSNFKNIERRIREIVKDYESKGYKVYINPNQLHLPSFLKNYEPDILAKKENDNVIIEVKTRNDRLNLQRFENLAKEIDKRKDWRFEMVFTNQKEKVLEPTYQNILSELEINNRILEINKLVELRSFEASFLLSWSTIEAVLRNKLRNEKFDTNRKTTVSIMKTMFSLGLINQHDYKALQKGNTYRNNLIHGFEQNIDRFSIQNILQLINNLTGKNAESEWLEWLEAVDLENYKEIYCLYLTAFNSENYGLFSITNVNDKIILKAGHMDETLEFENDEKLRDFALFIEEEYMEDMGAEGWYAFHRAMEKDD